MLSELYICETAKSSVKSVNKTHCVDVRYPCVCYTLVVMKKTRLKEVKTKVKRSRPGSGLGLFADEDIKKGTFVIQYKGKRIPTKVADGLGTKYLFEIDKKWTIDGADKKYGNKARYINHSCKPNCESEIDEYDRVLITAIKNIKKGEELSYDYGEEYFEEFIEPYGCKCDGCIGK